MSTEDAELTSVTTENGVIVFVYKNESDFNAQLSFLRNQGKVGVVKTRKTITRVFANRGVLYKYEQSVNSKKKE